MFKLQSKDSSADRQVPAMPLAFYKSSSSPGQSRVKVARYNLRKFSELPFQLVRCYRYKDLYDHVLFNYKVFNSAISMPMKLLTIFSGCLPRCQHYHSMRYWVTLRMQCSTSKMFQPRRR